MLAQLQSLLMAWRNGGDIARSGLREAVVMLDQGRVAEARAMAVKLARRARLVHQARYLESLIAEREGNAAQALEKIQAAIEGDPDETAYRLRAAELDFSLGHFARSRDGYVHLLGLENAPFRSDPLILFAAAGAFERSGDSERPIELLQQAVAIQPDFAEARSNLAALLDINGDPDQGRAVLAPLLKATLAPAPALRLRRALMLPVINASVETIAATRAALSEELDRLLAEPNLEFADPERDIGLTGFRLAYQGGEDRELLAKLGRVMRRGYAAARPPRPAARRVRAAGSRIRVGFVSTNFYFHSIARTTHGMIRDLPREHFEVYAFYIGSHQDEWSETIRRAADHHRNLPFDLGQVRGAIESAALDVLIFADIGMHPTTYCLAFWRLAPVQMVIWGHPDTTGIDSIDYFISSAQLEPEGAERFYSEKLLRLPGYFMPRYTRPHWQPLPRAELGLPEGRLYYCPQSLFKLHPDFDAAFKGILQRDNQAQILLLAAQPRPVAALRRRLDAALGELASRVHFCSGLMHDRFMQQLQAVDVILDPFHFGGSNSSIEAMAAGVPLVTLPAPQLRGRFTLGLYREMDMQECLVGSVGDYVDLAVRVANESDLRAQISATLAERAPALFERPDAGRALGQALLGIVEQGAPD